MRVLPGTQEISRELLQIKPYIAFNKGEAIGNRKDG
ncbi:MAG: hypothetical protein PWP06_710 [Candidatus Marinimicrobia bacterium]|jgi:hypothetical protein|nr:hypothetical protein [Candidatus Neomarinimicrobiota bacterium]